MDKRYDLIVIGAGPAGYVAAEAASKRGMKTAIIENREPGGTCLNRGCIPTKTIMHSSDIYRDLVDCEDIGVFASDISYSMERIQARKREVIETLRSGIVSMMKKSKVDIYDGTGVITTPQEVGVKNRETGESVKLHTGNILVCTGSEPVRTQIPGTSLPNVIDSDAILDSDRVYDRLVIIGGGVIGMEFASIYNALGTEVVVVEALDRILANMDKEISRSLQMLSKKRGIEIHTSSTVKSINPVGEEATDSVVCTFVGKDGEVEVRADAVLMAVGRRANTGGLFAEGMDITMDGDRIVVDENMCTGIPGIYAAGDVIGGVQLAHVASAEAITAVCHMNDEKPEKDIKTIPACVYTNPEIATVGLTQEEAKAAGIDAVSAKHPMSSNGKTLLSGQERGYIRVVAEKGSGRILGAQMMCARATDMIAIFADAIANGETASQMAAVIYPHPTFSEGIGEAATLIAARV